MLHSTYTSEFNLNFISSDAEPASEPGLNPKVVLLCRCNVHGLRWEQADGPLSGFAFTPAAQIAQICMIHGVGGRCS